MSSDLKNLSDAMQRTFNDGNNLTTEDDIHNYMKTHLGFTSLDEFQKFYSSQYKSSLLYTPPKTELGKFVEKSRMEYDNPYDLIGLPCVVPPTVKVDASARRDEILVLMKAGCLTTDECIHELMRIIDELV